MQVKKGDLVKIISGKDRQHGPAKVIRVLPYADKVVVEGRNLIKRHRKGNPALGTSSRIEEREAPIPASNVMLWSEKLQKPVRTQVRYVGQGGTYYKKAAEARASFDVPPVRLKKVRFSPKSEEVFD